MQHHQGSNRIPSDLCEVGKKKKQKKTVAASEEVMTAHEHPTSASWNLELSLLWALLCKDHTSHYHSR